LAVFDSKDDIAMSAEKVAFKTELKQILDIIIHSLYSHKEIFLRELISNASDASDTLRFEALTKPELKEACPGEFKIKITADEKAGTLTVADQGIGMTRTEIIENLGTIARSGTRAFLETLKQADVKERPELIGQFGVGFYSSFMAADRVTVISRKAGEPAGAGVRWESDGLGGEFTVETVEKPAAGTDVILHLKQEDREFLDPWRIRAIVKQYSDFVGHPIVMDVEKSDDKGNKTTVEETLNARKAIWLRPKAEISKEDYDEFYKHLSHDYMPPLKTIHYSAEGTIEFKALLYIPAHKTFDLLAGDWPKPKGLQLYIQRVFIMDDCEALMPLYLRFVKGVVDSPDLPLNVSREMLQRSAPLEKIKANIVNKVLGTLEELKRDEYDTYVTFWKEFGVFLKEGTCHEWSNRERLADLLLLESTRTEAGKYTALARYVEAMPAEQTEIYYVIGETRAMLEQTPYLEAFQAKNWEVLLLTEPIDEFLVQSLTEYKGKKLQAVDKGAHDPAGIDEEKKKAFGGLVDYMKGKLGELKDVRLTNRLKESAACLVADEHGPGAHLERLMQRLGRGQELPESKRILELNPDHAAVNALRQLHAKDAADPRLESFCRLLYDEAVIAEGSKPKDPLALARRINELIVKDAGTGPG
jgi:molecular chaperone HtpG